MLQSLYRWLPMTQAHSRLPNVVLTKLWSPEGCSGSIAAGPIEIFEVRLPTGERSGGLPEASPEQSGSEPVGESIRSTLARCRTISDFCISTLTRRRNGILSCGRRFYTRNPTGSAPAAYHGSDPNIPAERPSYSSATDAHKAPLHSVAEKDLCENTVLKSLVTFRSTSREWVVHYLLQCETSLIGQK